MVKKINGNPICFDFIFDMKDVVYINKRGHFDIDLKSLKCTIYL